MVAWCSLSSSGSAGLAPPSPPPRVCLGRPFECPPWAPRPRQSLRKTREELKEKTEVEPQAGKQKRANKERRFCTGPERQLSKAQRRETQPAIGGCCRCKQPWNNIYPETKVTTAFIWKLEVALPQRAAATNWFCNRGGAQLQPARASSSRCCEGVGTD